MVQEHKEGKIIRETTYVGKKIFKAWKYLVCKKYEV